MDSTKRKRLLIIEAPGKISAIKRVAEDYFGEEVLAIATKGRLYDLPKSSLGISVSKEDMLLMQQPINPDVIDRIKRLFSHASETYIITDNDVEGEVIARQIFDLISVDRQKNTYRLRLRCITSEEFEKAIKVPSEIDRARLDIGRRRRFLDRLLGFSCSGGREHSLRNLYSVGRVITPALSAISKCSNLSIGLAVKQIKSNAGSDLVLQLKLDGRHHDKLEEITSELRSLEDVVHVSSYSEIELKAKPWNYGDALLNITKLSGLTVENSAQALQRAYESGRISYPRSSLRQILKRDADKLSRLALKEGLFDFQLDKGVLLDDEFLQLNDSHAAISVDFNDKELSSALAMECVDDLAYSMILLNLLSCGISRKIKKYRLDISNNRMLFALLNDYGLRYSIIDYKQNNNNSFHLLSREELIGCRGSNFRATIKTSGGVNLYRYDKSVSVLEIITKEGLGRPSTLPYFATKIANRFLCDDLSLNGLGEACLNYARYEIPSLLNINTYHEIDEDIFSGSSISDLDFINKVFTKLGIKKENELWGVINNSGQNNNAELNIYNTL